MLNTLFKAALTHLLPFQSHGRCAFRSANWINEPVFVDDVMPNGELPEAGRLPKFCDFDTESFEHQMFSILGSVLQSDVDKSTEKFVGAILMSQRIYSVVGMICQRIDAGNKYVCLQDDVIYEELKFIFDIADIHPELILSRNVDGFKATSLKVSDHSQIIYAIESDNREVNMRYLALTFQHLNDLKKIIGQLDQKLQISLNDLTLQGVIQTYRNLQ